jgi:HTH-type transcriptional regulator / antitoxin HigA
MNQNLAPARIPQPGRILSRELDARGWTQKDLAEIMNRPAQAINEIVKGIKQITPETAHDLSEALGTSPDFWANLESKYRLHLAKKDKEEGEIARKSKLYSLAPLAELLKRGWIQKTDSVEKLEKNFCEFFGISTPDETPYLALNFRCAQHQDPEIAAQMAWAKRVENLARQQMISSFDRPNLQTAIPEILACAKQIEDLEKLPALLRSLGVHFVIVPHLSKTYLDGAVFYLDDNPVVALTLRYDRIDSFWFTLMHELGHVIAGHKGSYLDNMDSLEVNDEESEANQLASEWLIEPKALKDFSTTKRFSRKEIEHFARSQQRHPGIILGRLHHEQKVPHQNLRVLLDKVKPYLMTWIDT